MSNIVLSQAKKLADSFGIEGDAKEIVGVLKATAFKGDVTDAQLSALLIVASQYGLNPWTKEIYAFPDKSNGIVPVVGVDGWARIINENPQFDGMEFRVSETMTRMPGAKSDAPEWIEVLIYRKDRSRPTIVREYLDEVYREPFKGKYGDVTGPWQTHPKRFLRHKATIQGARLAFGFGNIFDQDEAERIAEARGHEAKFMGMVDEVPAKPAEPYDQAQFDANFPKWEEVIKDGRKSSEGLIAFIEAKGNPLTNEQKKRLEKVKVARAAPAAKEEPTDVQPKGEPKVEPAVTYAEVADRINKAETQEGLAGLDELIGAVPDPKQREELAAMLNQRAEELPPF